MEEQYKPFQMTTEKIETYLQNRFTRKYADVSLQSYRRSLLHLYENLPREKYIEKNTVLQWKKQLLQEGYAVQTINLRISVVNSFLKYFDRQELQCLNRFFALDNLPQPQLEELTREEYLRLLQAGKEEGKERTYLLIKTFCTVGLKLNELPQMTVEAIWGDVKRLARSAGVAEEKVTPKSLYKMYRNTYAMIQKNIEGLIEQIYEQMLASEQLIVGWEKGKKLILIWGFLLDTIKVRGTMDYWLRMNQSYRLERMNYSFSK